VIELEKQWESGWRQRKSRYRSIAML